MFTGIKHTTFVVPDNAPTNCAAQPGNSKIFLKMLMCLSLYFNHSRQREIGKDKGAGGGGRKRGKGEEGKRREKRRDRLYVFILFMKDKSENIYLIELDEKA